MPDHTPPTDQELDLDAIEAAINGYRLHPTIGFNCCSAHPVADAGAALVAEVRRLRARTLSASEYNSAWHAVEGAAGEDGADPGTVLHAVLDRLGIDWQDAARPAAAVVGPAVVESGEAGA